MRQDSVVGIAAMSLADLGVAATGLEDILAEYEFRAGAFSLEPPAENKFYVVKGPDLETAYLQGRTVKWQRP